MRRLSDYGAGAEVSCMGDLASSEESSSGSVIHTASDAGVAGTAPEIENCLGHKQTNARTVCGAPSHSKWSQVGCITGHQPLREERVGNGTAESADAVSR